MNDCFEPWAEMASPGAPSKVWREERLDTIEDTHFCFCCTMA